MQKDNDKNLQIFKYLSSFNLTLDKDNLDKQLNDLKACMKLYSPNSPTRKQLKVINASLYSIYTALNRVNPDILQKDLEGLKNKLNNIFIEFKTLTGITELPKNFKAKAKKKILTTLEDLVLLTEGKEKEDEVETVETYNLLDRYLANMKELLVSTPDYIFQKTSLLINAKTLNFQKLPRLGIIVSKTPYGIIWSGQYIMAVKKDLVLTVQELENLISKEFNLKFNLLYKSPMLTPDIPNYKFYWFMPVQTLIELGSLQVAGYSLPFPNNTNKAKVSIKELRKLRQESKNAK